MSADKNDLALILTSLAASLGIDPGMLALNGEIEDGTMSAGRRAQEFLIKFKVYATPQEMSAIDAKLKDPTLVTRMGADLQFRGVNAELNPIIIEAIAGLLSCRYNMQMAHFICRRDEHAQCGPGCSSM